VIALKDIKERDTVSKMKKKTGVLTKYMEKRMNTSKRTEANNKVENGEQKKGTDRAVRNQRKKRGEKEEVVVGDMKDISIEQKRESSSKVELGSNDKEEYDSDTTRSNMVSSTGSLSFPL
jgi:hypothetical protein